ncbi:hypothetical protein NL676_039623 [Syzygium grande]|nr:hypothetical protein NL676_039623 [Syzygium grande]
MLQLIKRTSPQGMTSRLWREDGRRRRSFAPETPHFFKIILSQALQTGRLGIPKRFVREYGKNLPETVRLWVPNGGIWRVELEKWDDIVWLSKGWKEFAEHYSVREGHFLVFKYVGHSDFHLLIFDKSASEIDYPLMDADSKKSNLDAVEFVPPKMGDADDHCNLSVGLQSLDDFSLKRKEKDGLHKKSYHHKPSKVMKSDPASSVDDATMSRAIVLGLGSKSKGFQTDQGAKLLPQDSDGRMENSKRKVSPAMLASHSSTSKRSRVTTALKAANKYEPQYPSFTVVIRSYNLLKGHATIPEGTPSLRCKLWSDQIV